MAVDFESWSVLWSSLGANGDGAEIWQTIVRHYQQSHRHYHTVQHLEECLNHLSHCQHLAEHPAQVQMALWFHDAIYDVFAHDNEQQSADWCAQILQQANVAHSTVQRIHALIMATQHHQSPQHNDQALLVDIDLAILAANPVRFLQYEQQIRQEYAHVPNAIFRQKRREILQQFFNRSRLYQTDYFYQRYEKQARINLQQALTLQSLAP